MSKLKLSYKKPVVQLSGRDGNAFLIMGRVKKAMKTAGATKELESYMEKAMSGDYDNLVQISMDYIEAK